MYGISVIECSFLSKIDVSNLSFGLYSITFYDKNKNKINQQKFFKQ